MAAAGIMVVQNLVFPDTAKPPSSLGTSPCSSEESFDSTANSATSIGGRFSDVEHKYHIDPRVLGTGSHGSVRKCLDRATGELYAVKSVRKADPAVKPGELARETGLLHEMRHRNIVRLVDVCEDAEYFHIVTDLCEGGELFGRIVERRSRGRDCRAPFFAEDEAAGILHQLLSAVSHLHDNGVVHRDIKPENVLFETADADSPIKVVDFGLARRHFGGDPPMTGVVGTPYYMAPEVRRGRYDTSCDLWSVGCIAYMMLCPFNNVTSTEVNNFVARGQLYSRYREWSGARYREWPGVSEPAEDFVRWLLQADPRKRMTADEALRHPWMMRHVRVHGATLAPYLPSAETLIRSYSAAKNEVPKVNSSLEAVSKRSSKRGSRLIRRIIQKLK